MTTSLDEARRFLSLAADDLARAGFTALDSRNRMSLDEISFRSNQVGENMNARVEGMMEQAQALTAEERVSLIDALTELVSPPDSGWQAAWARECEDRLAAYEQGKIEAEDFDVVMARLRTEYLGE